MADLTFEEFCREAKIDLSNQNDNDFWEIRTSALRRIYDHLRSTGVDIRAVVEGQPVLTQDEAALVVGAMPLQGFPVEPRPDLSRLRELVARLDLAPLFTLAGEFATWREIGDRGSGVTQMTGTECCKALLHALLPLNQARLELAAALDAIEKGGA